jgi:hypothetical protein
MFLLYIFYLLQRRLSSTKRGPQKKREGGWRALKVDGKKKEGAGK